MILAMKIVCHLLLDAALVALLWALLLRGRRRLRQWPILMHYHYAHRGLHDNAAGVPENSLGAFRAAAERGFGAELDVHLTHDGRLAVVHDSDLRRVCGRPVRVENLTVKTLSRLRLCGTEERIPFLEEVLPIFEGKAPLLIELKATRHNANATAQALCKAMANYKGDFCVESFDPRPLFWLRRHHPEIVRGQLSKNFLRDRAGGAETMNPVLLFLLKNLCLNIFSAPDFVAYRYEDRRNLSLRLCKKLYGVREFSWTIRSPAQQLQAEREGLIMIFEHFDPTQTPILDGNHA